MTVEGIYENGQVTLLETPAGVEKARVRVTFLSDLEPSEERMEDRKDSALQHMMEFMRQGLDFGDDRFDREELYRERQEQLEQRRG